MMEATTMMNIAYTHLETSSNDNLSAAKVGGFRLAGRRGPRGPISTVRIGWPDGRFARIGITILGDLISTAVPADIPANIGAELRALVIEAVETSGAYRGRCQHAQRANGAEWLRFAYSKQERT
jgi:hypothetical protein